ncbi:hypothetical protein ACFLZM_08160 [Thermodesulfobacteriota bacterium]
MSKKKPVSISFKPEAQKRWKENDALIKRFKIHPSVEVCDYSIISLKDDINTYDVNNILDLLFQYGFSQQHLILRGVKKESFGNLVPVRQ